jgi:hypothetical protein
MSGSGFFLSPSGKKSANEKILGKKKRVDYIVFCFTNDPLTSDFITWVVKI